MFTSMFAYQLDQELAISPDEAVKFQLSNEALFVLNMPCELVTTEVETMIQHVAMTSEEIREELKAERKQANGSWYIEINKVLSLKEKKIFKAVSDLLDRIYQLYKNEADLLGLELNTDNFYQEITLPLMYKDLTPGDTTILFNVFTKRRLVKKRYCSTSGKINYDNC